MDKEEFIIEMKKIGIDDLDKKIKLLDRYYDLLVEWNEKINLTAITEKDKVYLKHFYDSLTLVKVIDFNKQKTFLDVGTGAGFPGLVIKIFFPHLEVTLLDSLNKRINFLECVIGELSLKDIKCVHARAEEYALSHRESYDIVTARAVSSLNILIEMCFPMVKIGGYFIPMRGKDEGNYDKAVLTMNGKILLKENFLLPYENSERTIIKIIKEKKSECKYQRRYCEMKKKPL